MPDSFDSLQTKGPNEEPCDAIPFHSWFLNAWYHSEFFMLAFQFIILRENIEHLFSKAH